MFLNFVILAMNELCLILESLHIILILSRLCSYKVCGLDY